MTKDTNEESRPQSNRGEIFNWPMLRLTYKTNKDKLAELLPPGIEAMSDSLVTITIYNFPVNNEPEYGVVVNASAKYQDIEGDYTLGIGINQEAAIYTSHEHWGQPKYLAETHYFRMGDHVDAKVIHQGHTFVQFSGEVVGQAPNPPEYEHNEWWIKCLRSVDMSPGKYDFPPHVVRVKSTYGTSFMEELKGDIVLRESPWDPIATQLPMEEQISAYLWTPIFLGREITLEGELDGEGFWPFSDTIGGSRWPGLNGGPKP